MHPFFIVIFVFIHAYPQLIAKETIRQDYKSNGENVEVEEINAGNVDPR